MDGLSAASGVITVVGLAKQVLSGLRFLNHFLDDISNAPDFMQILRKEVSVLETILKAVVEYDAQMSNSEEELLLTLAPSIEVCCFWVTRLELLMRKCGLGASSSRMKRQWQSLKHALNKTKIEECMVRLSQVQITLLQAQVALEGPRQARLQSRIARLLEQGERDRQDLNSLNTNLESLTKDQSQRSSIIQQNQADLDASVSELASHHSTSAQILQRIDRNVRLEGMAERRATELHNVLGNLLSPGRFSSDVVSHLMPVLQPCISKAVHEGFQQAIDRQNVAIEMKDLKKKSSDLDLPSETHNESRAHVLGENAKTDTVLLDSIQNIYDLPAPWRKYSTIVPGSRVTYDTLVGRLICQTSNLLREQKDLSTDDLISRDKIFICRITYIPSAWLRRWIPPSKLKWMDQEIKNPSFQISIEPLRIVTRESAVMTACAHGNLPIVRQLLYGQEASIYDRSDNGDTILDIALEIDRSVDLIDFTYYRQKLDTALWLIDQGVDSGASNFSQSGSSLARYVHSFAGFYDDLHNFDLERALISSMIRRAKTDPFQGTSEYLLPRTWNWNGNNHEQIGSTWGRHGIWDFLLPPILCQDIWPYKENLDIDSELLSRIIDSAFSQFRLPEALSVAKIGVQNPTAYAKYCHEEVKSNNIYKSLDFTQYQDFENIKPYLQYKHRRRCTENAEIVMNEVEKANLLTALNELLNERVPLLKSLLTKWTVSSLKGDRFDQMRLIQVLGRQSSAWLDGLQYINDPAQLSRVSKAAWDLVDVIIECNGSGLTVFGSVTEMLFSAVGSKRRGWPPRSRIAPGLVDILSEGRLPEKLRTIPAKVSEAECAQALKGKFVVPENVIRRSKMQRRRPLLASIATFSLPVKKNDDINCPLSISLSEQVHPVAKDIHDETAEAEPLELRRFICELSFDSPTELSITVLQEFSMSVEFSIDVEHASEHEAYVKRYEKTCKCARCQRSWNPASQISHSSCGALLPTIDLGCFETMETDLEVSEAQTQDPQVPGAWITDQSARDEDLYITTENTAGSPKGIGRSQHQKRSSNAEFIAPGSYRADLLERLQFEADASD